MRNKLYSNSFHAVLALSCRLAKYQCYTATVTTVVVYGHFFKFFQFFFFEAKNSHGKCIFHRNTVKIKHNVRKYTRKNSKKNVAQNFFIIAICIQQKNQNSYVRPYFFLKFCFLKTSSPYEYFWVKKFEKAWRSIICHFWA